MALVMAYEEAQAHQHRHAKTSKGSRGTVVNTPFIGSRSQPDLPLAILNQHEPGGTYSNTHFHTRDQFQVVIDGRGKIGRHELTPYTVHFSRAYTPYGPLSSDPSCGLTFFVMRARPEQGPQFLPQELEQLRKATDRRPWQVTRSLTFPATPATDSLLRSVPGIADDGGLAAYTLSVRPNAIAKTPDPAHSDGQFLVVVKGSLFLNDKEHRAWALVFVAPHEGPLEIHAGSEGLQAIVLHYPQVKVGSASMAQPATTRGLKRWRCALCSFTYDEALGIPDEGIASGTRWADVPDTWTCPDCGSNKSDFQMVEQ